ncbi:hypothetical protein TNCV_4308891 [Trichonephila clavipes]|nr:hypothetical protein TNCV_4308891 [Trichonephila clavipes]
MTLQAMCHFSNYSEVAGGSVLELLNPQLKLSGAIAHEGQNLLCQSLYTRPLGAEVYEHMSRSGGQSEARSPVFNFL